MTALIVYASNSGSTHLVAKQISELLESAGIQCTVKKAVDTNSSDLQDHELILFGSPSWKVDGVEGQPHETMTTFLNSLDEKSFENKYLALFGCGDSSYLHFCNAVDVMNNTVTEKKATQLVEPLKIDAYFFDLDNNLAKVEEWALALSRKIPVNSII